jgi:hypothetical protein
MVMRFLYWFYFLTSPSLRAIPELNRLPYEERMWVVIEAQQAGWLEGMSDLRPAYWALAYINVSFVAGFLFFTGRWTLGLLLLGIMMGWALYLTRGSKKMMRQGILRALEKRAKAAAKT